MQQNLLNLFFNYSNLIKKEFHFIKDKLWEKYFWTRSYCLISTGGATIDEIKKYIENQGKEK